jgi:hypothetical protein
VELVLLVIVALFLIYLVGGARPWPLQECPRCKGKGRFTHTTIFGTKVAKDCPDCSGGWRRR